jgi:hypothetical protein
MRPGCSGRGITLFGKVPMDSNHVDGLALKHTIREILNPVYCLGPRDAATDHGDVGAVETNGELEMVCYVAEPGFTGRDGTYATEWFVLKINALAKSIAV